MEDLPSKVQRLQELDSYSIETYLREVRRNEPVERVKTTDEHVIVETESFIGKHEFQDTTETGVVHAAEKGTYRVKHDDIDVTFTSRTLPEDIGESNGFNKDESIVESLTEPDTRTEHTSALSGTEHDTQSQPSLISRFVKSLSTLLNQK